VTYCQKYTPTDYLFSDLAHWIWSHFIFNILICVVNVLAYFFNANTTTPNFALVALQMLSIVFHRSLVFQIVHTHHQAWKRNRKKIVVIVSNQILNFTKVYRMGFHTSKLITISYFCIHYSKLYHSTIQRGKKGNVNAGNIYPRFFNMSRNCWNCLNDDSIHSNAFSFSSKSFFDKSIETKREHTIHYSRV